MDNIKVDGYNSGFAPSPPPEASKFDRGTSTDAGIKQAIDARIAHSDKTTREAASQFRQGSDK